MISNAGANLLNANIGSRASQYTYSENKYYNIFSKQMEVIELPKIDLEFNAVLIPEKSTFMRTC